MIIKNYFSYFNRRFYILISLILLTIIVEGLRFAYYNKDIIPNVQQENERFENHLVLERKRIQTIKQEFKQSDRHKIFKDSHRSDGGILIALTIITQRRQKLNNDQQYLEVSLWNTVQLIQSLPPNTNFSVHLLLCSIDRDYANHEQVRLLSDYFHTVHRYANNTRFSFETNVEKEYSDYRFCLNETLKLNAEYLLILQDDAIPKEDFFSVIHSFLSHQMRRNSQFLYLKLYHPVRLLGYIQPEINRLVELFGLTSCITMVLLLVISRQRNKHVQIRDWLFVGCCTFLCLIVIGRSPVLWFRGLHPNFYSIVPPPACCIPGMLYSKNSARYLLKELGKQGSSLPIDEAIHEIYRNSSFHSWSVQPNLLKHIGRASNLRENLIDARIVE